MRPSDLLDETYSAVTVNKARSGLTMLGIVIGIASVIALVAVGQGAKNSIQSSIQSIGANLLMVRPGAERGFGGGARGARGSAQTLTMADAQAITDQATLAAAVAPEVDSRFQVTATGTNTNTSIIGTTPAYLGIREYEIQDGTFITQQHLDSMSKVAVLGPTTASDLFGDGVNPVGKTIRINNIQFQVIGMTVSKGGSGFGNADDQIWVPLTTAQQFLSRTTGLNMISVEAVNAKSMTDLQQQITYIMLAQHHISDPTQADFNVINQADIVSAASSVTGTLTALLTAIAAISLLVGGIGIMNMMLTTVTERTREIGLRKAIGAKRRDVIMQFLGESVMLTFIGGGIGIVLGWLISLAATKFANLPSQVTLSSVIIAFGVSAGIGIIFGYYPARRASRMSPIEALRYE